jgi:hypothetical protein
MTKIVGSGSISQRHGSVDPDPPQNVMDPQHRVKGIFQPFELGGETGLIRFDVKYWVPGKF